ncbi:MAG: cysteine-rich KTR domain-containing protein [Faecousia sp.]
MDKSKNRAIMATVVSGRVICPRCGRQTRQRVRPDTEIKNFPVFCTYCKTENVISIAPAPQSQSQ